MKLAILMLVVLIEVSVAAEKIQSFSLLQMNGERQNYSSEEHPTGIFVIEAYFLNCSFCNDNARNVNDITSKYASNPRVQVLDVGVDRDDSLYQVWIDRHRPNHPVLKDAKQHLIAQLGTLSFPSTYVVSCGGKVVYRSQGVWSSQTRHDIERAIDSLNEEDCPL